MNRRRRNRNNIIKFSARSPFSVTVLRKDVVWLVTCRNHSWLHSDRREAVTDAKIIAAGFGVAVRVSL